MFNFSFNMSNNFTFEKYRLETQLEYVCIKIAHPAKKQRLKSSAPHHSNLCVQQVYITLGSMLSEEC